MWLPGPISRWNMRRVPLFLSHRHPQRSTSDSLTTHVLYPCPLPLSCVTNMPNIYYGNKSFNTAVNSHLPLVSHLKNRIKLHWTRTNKILATWPKVALNRDEPPFIIFFTPQPTSTPASTTCPTRIAHYALTLFWARWIRHWLDYLVAAVRWRVKARDTNPWNYATDVS